MEVGGEVRMTLIVRQDLKMGKGKAAAQCLHATLALYEKITNPESVAYNPEMVERWKYGKARPRSRYRSQTRRIWICFSPMPSRWVSTLILFMMLEEPKLLLEVPRCWD